METQSILAKARHHAREVLAATVIAFGILISGSVLLPSSHEFRGVTYHDGVNRHYRITIALVILASATVASEIVFLPLRRDDK